MNEPSERNGGEQAAVTAVTDDQADDAIVCFCYRITARQIKEAQNRYGSLANAQAHTRAGTACGGCRIALNALCDEQPDDINKIDRQIAHGTACSKPGNRLMRGFIIANDKLESSVYSSNGVAPHLGSCDTTTTMNYQVLDRFGRPVVTGSKQVKTNETFVFNTVDYDLPRPFLGTFLLELGRSNFGGARFNVYWVSNRGRTSTHENSSTGRPLISLPAIFEKNAITKNNDIYFAFMNPHSERQEYSVNAFDIDTGQCFSWESSLDANECEWLDVGNTVLAQAFQQSPKGRFSLRVSTSTLNPDGAITTYFFFHNRISDVWTSNHL